MAFNYTPLNTIFSWFQTGDFPTQDQFQNSWSSFWHKGEQIPLGMIESLDIFMQSTASAEALENHINSSTAHYDYLAAKDANNLDEENTIAWRNKLGVQDVPENIALVDLGENQSVFNKDQITSLCLLLSEYVNNDGKILADKIEALGLTELITVTENTLSAFIGNYQSYNFEKNDIIAIPDVNGNFSLYIFKGDDKTNSTNYLPTGLSNITISMVQGLQAALDGKMNKPTSYGDFYVSRVNVGGVDYYQYKTISLTAGQIPRSYGSYIGESAIFEDAGNKIGIGTITPSEKLDVNGNVKANAYKFNLQATIPPTPNTHTAKEDGTRPIWFDNNSVRHDVALKDDLGDTFLGEVIYNGNQEFYFSSFDYATSTGTTSSPHGLTIGTSYQGGIVANCFKNFDSLTEVGNFDNQTRTIPWEFLNSFIVTFKPTSATEIQILEWNSGGVPTTINTTSTNNNGNLTSIGWHLELAPYSSGSPFFNIVTNLPQGIKGLRIEVVMNGWSNFSPYTANRFRAGYHNGSGGETIINVGGNIGANPYYLDFSAGTSGGTNKTNILSKFVIEIDGTNLMGLVRTYGWTRYRASGNNTFTNSYAQGINGFVAGTTYGFFSLAIQSNYFANGTKFKTYRLQ